jgi:D-aminoacyl-tRNA deacylase
VFLELTALIVASKRDVAAQNVAEELVRLKGFQPVAGASSDLFQAEDTYLKLVETDGILTENLGLDIRPDAVIFASRHRSESGEPALTTHWTGNCTSRADFGGTPRSLSFTDPPRLRAALLALDAAREAMKLNYTVTLEATHHGPTGLGVPTLFIELGATEKEWSDRHAAAALSEAVWKAATAPVIGKTAVGFGGGHYCNKQCAAVRNDGYAFSHILSKYFFDDYDEEIVRMAFDRTIGGCRTAVVDWKGVRGPQRSKLLETLKQMNVEVVRV